MNMIRPMAIFSIAASLTLVGNTLATEGESPNKKSAEILKNFQAPLGSVELPVASPHGTILPQRLEGSPASLSTHAPPAPVIDIEQGPTNLFPDEAPAEIAPSAALKAEPTSQSTDTVPAPQATHPLLSAEGVVLAVNGSAITLIGPSGGPKDHTLPGNAYLVGISGNGVLSPGDIHTGDFIAMIGLEQGTGHPLFVHLPRGESPTSTYDNLEKRIALSYKQAIKYLENATSK